MNAIPRPRSLAAFTLFEVGISLLILSVAIVAMALAYPVGIKAQQLSRFKLYAGTKALEILDTFANHDHQFFDRQIEAEKLGQCTFSGGVPVDLDRMMCWSSLGLMPLPNDIARRLDSENDEIAKILQDGGRIFYSSAFAFETGYQIRGYQRLGAHNTVLNGIPTEAQSLLFAVVGYAQQNALANHPCLAWPYFAYYPTPPQPWEKNSWDTWEVEGKLPAGAKAKLDVLYPIFNATNFYAPSGDPATIAALLTKAQDLLVATLPASCVDGTSSPEGPFPKDPLALPAGGSWDIADERSFAKPWSILAMRYLAMIAMSRTGDGAAAPSNQANMEQYAELCHEAMVKWIMRYAVANPYDWGAPRPLNRQNALDFPLLQFDLFPTASNPTPFAVGDGTADVTWKVIGARQPVNYGQARGVYGAPGASPQHDIPANHAAIDASWGDMSHFNLTKTFAAAERDRELVCFAVDWRSYEDFEEAPSGPFDSTCYNYDSRGVVVDYERSHYPPDVYDYWFDGSRTTIHEWIQYAFGTRDQGDANYLGDGSESAAFKSRHLGIYGADRNGNGVFDRGPVPKSVRLRAVSIGRWNFYDRRFISGLRY